MMASIFRHGDKPAVKRNVHPTTVPSQGGPDHDQDNLPEGQDARYQVVLHFQSAVEQGHAIWRTNTEGEWELHLATGDIFALTNEGVTRRR
jgi:hypothetical protein